MKKIPLSQGQFAIVDDDMFVYLNQWKWYAYNYRGSFYARRNAPRSERKIIHMHRVIMKTPDGMDVDHIFGKTLDNRRSKMRNVTRAQNQMNHKVRNDNTSGHCGVFWDKDLGKWRARIQVEYKTIYLGCFSEKSKAIKARNRAEKKYFGQYRRHNDPA